jgi:hypothetical protein
MGTFPRTKIGDLSVSRMIIGTNWFLGWSHTTNAKDNFIKESIRDRKKIADIIEVFFRNGVDTVMGQIDNIPLKDAIMDAEDRTGVKGIVVSTPSFTTNADTPTKGFDRDEAAKILDTHAKLGANICMPHQCTTDAMVDRCTRQIRGMPLICEMIRERNMIPGLSTHMPETIIYADETNLDVETYIQIYNSMGFLMQVEVDWISQVINNAKKPVMTIKPFAAGQVRPFQGLAFVWNTIRPQDMVTVGTMTPAEAQEVIDISLKLMEHSAVDIMLQETRSKGSIRKKKSA